MLPLRNSTLSRRNFLKSAAGLATVLVTGCSPGNKQLKHSPRSRMGTLPSSTLGARFANPENLGTHSYYNRGSENNGIIYTRRGGHIDLAHLGTAADWTAYLTALTKYNLSSHSTEFSFKSPEKERYFIKINYPRQWNLIDSTTKERTKKDISLKLGKYLASSLMTWHEIITWHGHSIKSSAFSWEDTYSNNLGVQLAGIAIKNIKTNFNDSMTRTLNKALEYLEVVDRKTAKQASRAIAGKWYGGGTLWAVNMKKRNLDTGIGPIPPYRELRKGFITPWLVREMGHATPVLFPVPQPSVLHSNGFYIQVTMHPKTRSGKKVARKLNKKTINPETDIPITMERIVREAVSKHGENVGRPYDNVMVALSK